MPEIKAVVFKTPELKTTRLFFENTLKFNIEESSVRHFVIYSKGLRLIFIASQKDFEIELYLSEAAGSNQTSFKIDNDPNGINIIRVFNHQKNN
ncbi:hypothetical protein [Flavobacterium wongokense]|uniref:hypothetical protein n=1 Tax=Flavobacterium wongokense TaxID=2910674 RepID=UPI001F32758A|nr:hypothetical protein [Flavobacterium sp. WG47]MCF6133150.1 hypothetical protein [Flavobacterium sp. WG47]